MLCGRPHRITSLISGLSIPRPYVVVAIRIRHEGETSPFLTSFKVPKSAAMEVLEVVEQIWSRDVVGVAEDLALGLMWNKNAVERNKTIVYN